jgi:hypothetical protein
MFLLEKESPKHCVTFLGFLICNFYLLCNLISATSNGLIYKLSCWIYDQCARMDS